jgi:hypothetical protein
LRNIFTLLSLFFLVTFVNAQSFPVTENTEISIITIGPGEQLYDSFGHSAYRIKDDTEGYDVAFNYGVYDFETPNFYTKFAQGKLLYQLDVRNYDSFEKSYIRQNRWIKEQILNLSYSEKKELSDFLWNNAQPENKKYKYDFFFDNCATKIRDVTKKVLDPALTYNEDHITQSYSFRDLIRKNLDENSWGSLGIDVALGAIIDRKAQPIEYQFLPDYIYSGAKNAVITRNGVKEPLVKKDISVFEAEKKEVKKNFFTSPLFIFGIIGLLILFVTYKDFKNNTRSRFLDTTLFLVTGLIGVFLLLLWFATDHTATANNYNLLLAFPFNLLLVFAISKKYPKVWVRKYVFFLLLMLVLLTVHWITGVQLFAIGLIPLFISLAVRWIYLIVYLKKVNQ